MRAPVLVPAAVLATFLELHRRGVRTLLELADALHVELGLELRPGRYAVLTHELTPRIVLFVAGDVDARSVRREGLHALVRIVALRELGLDVRDGFHDVDEASLAAAVAELEGRIGLPPRPRRAERPSWAARRCAELVLAAEIAAELATRPSPASSSTSGLLEAA